MKKLKLFVSIVAILLLSSLLPIGAISAEVQILIKGTITDEFTGKPAGIIIEIKDEEGRKIKINSNSVTGHYEQVLVAGKSYTISLSNYDIIRKTVQIKTDDVRKYDEQTFDFTIQKFSVGLQFEKYDAFSPGSDAPSASLKGSLEKLAELMRFNRNVKFDFMINSHDTYSKGKVEIITEIPKSKKKGKKDKAAQEVKENKLPDPEPQLIQELVNKRIKALESLIANPTFSRRVALKPDYSLAEYPAEGESLSQHPDFIVVVSEIEDQLKK